MRQPKMIRHAAGRRGRGGTQGARRRSAAKRRSMMTLKELADALENIDEEAFASLLLEYELNHDDGPKQVKAMIIDALRFSDQHGLRAPRPPLDEAD
jgi:hypothetical protein